LPVSYFDASFVLMMLCSQLRAEDSQPSADVDDALQHSSFSSSLILHKSA
jgi:hypothetical protein